MPQTNFRVLSLNIHKGFAMGPKRLVLSRIRELLRNSQADIVFLQEVVGENERHAKKLPNWPASTQLEYLADSIWTHHAYGKNAIYQHGHHGNAILSGQPFDHWENVDVSVQRFSQRGFLHGRIGKDIHLICVHFGLFEKERKHQLSQLINHVHRKIPKHAPLIVAGDFNDWRQNAHRRLTDALGATEAHESIFGRCAKTFPAFLPLLPMDRIYLRGFKIHDCSSVTGKSWREFSDHKGLIADIALR